MYTVSCYHEGTDENSEIAQENFFNWCRQNLCENIKTCIAYYCTYISLMKFLLETARVIPFYKRSDPKQIDNYYRLISLLSAFSK